VTVLVSIPYWRTPELVEKAVRSVLKQTHRDLVCVVVGDGDEPPLSKVRDSRLVVHSYSTNRGAYFALPARVVCTDRLG
jgi:glycosyltransferase involved in cell wall biosynthesis